MVVDADNNLSITSGNGVGTRRGFRPGAIYLYIVLIRWRRTFECLLPIRIKIYSVLIKETSSSANSMLFFGHKILLLQLCLNQEV